MSTALTVLIWLACAWLVVGFIGLGIAIHRIRRDHKGQP